MKRELSKKENIILYVYASVFTITQLFILLSNRIDARIKYVIFVGFTTSITFLKYKASSKSNDKIKLYDYFFATLSIVCAVYYVCNYKDILYRSIHPTSFDIIFACLTILLIIEACRRTIGIILPLISIIALIYAFFGENLPGIWGHRHYSIDRIINILYMTDNGIFGSITKVATTTVFAFMFMGTFFKQTSIGNIITKFINSITGNLHGGAALVSVISSGLFGMMSGSAASNVVTTGQFTIPMMKEEGFEPEYAAAVEAVASAGGTLTPPVLGAAIFVMMEILQLPYNTIVRATILPSLIYYISTLFMIYFIARKKSIKGKKNNEKPIEILNKKWMIFLPVILLFAMILSGAPLIQTAFISTALMIFISLVNKNLNVTKKDLVLGVGDTGISCLPTAMACICSGIIIGILNLTGLPVRFSEIIINLSTINIIFALIATMVMLIILGMGLPAVASYIIGASIAAPVLISIGIPNLTAHLFIFYFSCLSSITPPVALNAYLAAGIASANPLKTAFICCMLCFPIFAIPYMFVYQPAVMMQENLLNCILVTISCILGVLCVSVGIVGYFRKKVEIFERILCLISGILLFDTNVFTDIIAIIIVLLIIILNISKKYFKIFNKI